MPEVAPPYFAAIFDCGHMKTVTTDQTEALRALQETPPVAKISCPSCTEEPKKGLREIVPVNEVPWGNEEFV